MQRNRRQKTLGTWIQRIAILVLWANLASSLAVAETAKSSESKRGAYRTRVFQAFTIPDYQVDQALAQKIEEEISILTRLAKKQTDPNRRAEILFRLAELFWLKERAQFVSAMEKYEKQFDLYTKNKRKEKPVIPTFSGQKSFLIYKKIVETAPNYHRLDEVLFLAGFHAMEVNDDSALGYFEQLVKRFPSSPYRLDAYMEIGEFQFLKRKLPEAIEAFKIVLKEPSKLYNYALYKIAWCFYNQGKIPEAMSILKQVVKTTRGVKFELELREESLRDLILFFSDLGMVDEAEQYFLSIGEPEYARKALEKLSGIFFDQARYDKSVYALRKLIALDPLQEDVPKNHSKIIECFEKGQGLEQVLPEMEKFLTTYQPSSPWYLKNTNPEARGYADKRSEAFARFIATKYHELLQKEAKTNSSEVKKYTHLALNNYQRYLSRFAKFPQAYELRYLYAELLFKNQFYVQAANQFAVVAKTNKTGPRRKEALIGLMDALARLEEDFYKKMVAGGFNKDKSYTPTPLSEYASRLIEANSMYSASFPKDPRLPEILFQSAQLQYNYNNFKPAKAGFFNVIQKFPVSDSASSARHGILDILNIQKDWIQLEKWANNFLNVKSFATPKNRTLLLELIQGSIFQRAKALEDKKQFREAAKLYQHLTNTYPDSKFADKSLFNAAINYIQADDSEPAMQMAQQFLQKFPKSDLVPKMLAALATYFDDKLAYANAATYYELLAERDPKGENAADALYNAGLYRENLANYSQALKNYDTYLERYPRNKDAAEIFFSKGLIFEKKNSWKQAAEIFGEFPNRYPNQKARIVESHFRLANARKKLGRPDLAIKEYQRTMTLGKKFGVGNSFAAKAKFELTQDKYNEFKAIKLRMPQKVLTRGIEMKAQLLKELRNHYTDVINFADPGMGVAALFRIGSIYQDFSQALFNAPIPKELSPEEVMIYQTALQERASPIEQKAIEAFETAVKKSFELHVYNEWSKKAYESLTQYKPAEYPPVRATGVFTFQKNEPLASFEMGNPQ